MQIRFFHEPTQRMYLAESIDFSINHILLIKKIAKVAEQWYALFSVHLII